MDGEWTRGETEREKKQYAMCSDHVTGPSKMIGLWGDMWQHEYDVRKGG